MALFQYIKDTQGELRHVAWPTRMQTVIYTILVASISVGIALYLGFFDYIFTSTLARYVGADPVPQNQPGIQVETEGDANGLIIEQQPIEESAPSLDDALPGADSAE